MSIRSMYKKNKGLIVLIVITILVLAGAFLLKIINCDEQFFQNDSLHFNILSVNAIIAGFLFTGLSIIVTVIDKERIKRLSENGYLDIFYNTIFAGIAFHVISLLLSIMNMFRMFSKAIMVLGYLEIGFLLLGLVVFMRAVLYLREIIQIVKKGD